MTACLDWERRIIAGESIIPPPIYPEEAERALNIFKQLRVVDLPGRPTFGECSEQWVFDFVSAVFGAYDAKTGQQKVNEFFMLISKKNTKSTISAGVMLTALILCWREEEEHLILAPTVEVANASFGPAASMVRADEELSDMFHIQGHIRTITHRVTKNSLKVVAADTNTVSGKKSGRILIDELWVMGKNPKADGMLMEATGGMVSRDEGFVIYLSTQSDDPPAGVFKEKLDYFRGVRDGLIQDSKSLPIIYEYPQSMIEDKSYLNPDNFYIANPNLGRSVSREWLQDNLKKNMAKNDGGLQKFLAKHLNIQIGMNLRADRWAGANHWQDQHKSLSLDEIIERSDVITIGIDGGGLDDLLGAYVMGRDKFTSDKLGIGFAWAHQSVLKLRQEIAPALLDFEKDGSLSVVRYPKQDLIELAQICLKVFNSGLLDSIGVDPAGIGSVIEALEDVGISEDEYIRGVSQGWKLGGAVKTVERWLSDESFSPAEQPLMTWCVGNAKIEQRSNSILVTKQASGTAKIDPLIALFNAATMMSLNPDARGSLNDFLRSPLIV